MREALAPAFGRSREARKDGKSDLEPAGGARAIPVDRRGAAGASRLVKQRSDEKSGFFPEEFGET